VTEPPRLVSEENSSSNVRRVSAIDRLLSGVTSKACTAAVSASIVSTPAPIQGPTLPILAVRSYPGDVLRLGVHGPIGHGVVHVEHWNVGVMPPR